MDVNVKECVLELHRGREVNWQVNLGLTERLKARESDRAWQIVSKAVQPGHLSAGEAVCLVNPGLDHNDSSSSDRPFNPQLQLNHACQL